MEFFTKAAKAYEEEEDQEEEESEDQELRHNNNNNVACNFFPHQDHHHQPALMDLTLRIDTHGGGGGGNEVAVEREHMFDKVVTPSDVGKLNRLVIPKQHAEKYFPLDSSTNDKGLILNFEDRNGKPWRFRYSYWNSSQSYVMTKGWSRFVKDKKLDAGDVVSFQRGLGESAKDRLFIDWRRRPDAPTRPPHHHFSNPLLLRWHPPPPPPRRSIHMNYSTLYPNYAYQMSNYGMGGGGANNSVYYLKPPMAAAAASSASSYRVVGEVINQGCSSMVVNKGGSGGSTTAAKRLRLFGVNMECSAPDDAGGGGDLPNGGVSIEAGQISRRGKEPLSLNWDLLH